MAGVVAAPQDVTELAVRRNVRPPGSIGPCGNLQPACKTSILNVPSTDFRQ